MKIYYFVFILLFISCSSPKKEVGPSLSNSKEVNVIENELLAKSEIDNAMHEVHTMLSSSKYSNARDSISKFIIPCGSFVDTFLQKKGIYTISFDPLITCNGSSLKQREGQIIVKLLKYPLFKYRHAGSQLLVEFKNYKIWLANNSSIVINGRQIINNENDGSIQTLQGTEVLIQRIRGNITLESSSGKLANWNWARKRTYSADGMVEVGDTLIDSTANVYSVGIVNGDRHIVVTEKELGVYECNNQKLILDGRLTYFNKTQNEKTTIQFGVNKDGIKAKGCVDAYGSRWSNINSNGQVLTKVVAYK